MDKHINKTKRIFLAIIVALVVMMAGGIFIIRGSNVMTRNNFNRHYSYFKYLMMLEKDEGNLFASVSSSVTGLVTIAVSGNGDRGSDPGTVTSIPVLLYHGINNDGGKYDTAPEVFWEQMRAMKEAGYETLSIGEFENIMNGKHVPDGKKFLLTFDDGRMDSYVGADPVIRALGYSAVMYIASNNSLKKNGPHSYYLGFMELDDMLKSGRWEIGSHAAQSEGDAVVTDAEGTRLEFLSNKKWIEEEGNPEGGRIETDREYAERVKDELGGSRERMEKALGVKVASFAYPSSDYGQRAKNNPGAQYVISEVIRKEYKMAFQQVWPEDNAYTLNYPGMDMFHLGRIETPGDWSGEKLVSYIRNAEAKSFPYSEQFSGESFWKSSWGKVAVEDHALKIEAGTTTAGAVAMLDGTYGWKDYMYAVSVDRQKGGYVTLYSRYEDPSNHISCVFGGGRVRINKRVDGEDFLLKDDKDPVKAPDGIISLGISADGPRIGCYEGSVLVSSTTDETGFNPDQGGIALQVWDESIGNAAIAVRSLQAVHISESAALLDILPKYALLPVPKPVVVRAAPAKPKKSIVTAVKVFDISLKDKSGKPSPYIVNGSGIRSVSSDSTNTPGIWITGSNKMDVGGNAATLSTVPPFVSASSILQGGFKWADYEYVADITLGISSKVSAVGRYANSNNYIACEYMDRGSWVMLIHVKDGQRRFLGGDQDAAALSRPFDDIDRQVGMRAIGNTISCVGQGGSEIVRAEVPDTPKSGTIGMKVYAETPGNAAVHIKKAVVTPL